MRPRTTSRAEELPCQCLQRFPLKELSSGLFRRAAWPRQEPAYDGSIVVAAVKPVLALPLLIWRTAMNKETPQDDPRKQTDRGSHRQTSEPWQGNPEKDQKPAGGARPDLEKWQQSNTH